MTTSSRPNFSRDSKRERIVAEYLDKFFYSDTFYSFERIESRKEQLAGMDIIVISNNNDKMIIDEKAATSWAHREIHTFAFELSFLLGDKEISGWFLNKNNRYKNTHWLCVWPRTNSKEIRELSDISSAEIVLINCKKIRRWMRSMASKDQKSLESIEKRLRNEKNINQIDWSGLRVIISRNLPEQPINVLIPKEILRILSEGNTWNI
ncbi:hypothetical protein OAQ40_04820 [Euryarchaeota archaeon]|nr:hypothetical protein [Euryarchaeota archaeon]